MAQPEVADTGQRKSEEQLKWRTSTAASNITSNTSEVKIERLTALLLILYSKLQF